MPEADAGVWEGRVDLAQIHYQNKEKIFTSELKLFNFRGEFRAATTGE